MSAPKKVVGYPAPPLCVQVTREMAAEWLERNRSNRPLDQSFVNQLVDDIQNGRWEVTHQGIAFFEDGDLADGQHRLWAVVLSGHTVPIMVSHGVPRSAMKVIDTGKGRSAKDVAQLTGVTDRGELFSILRQFPSKGGARVRYSPQAKIELLQKHMEAITFAADVFPQRRKRLTTCVFMGVLARAWYTADRERLTQFSHILALGSPNEEPCDRMVFEFREGLIRVTRPDEAGVQRARFETVLQAYLDKRALKVIRPATEEHFPFPGENALAKAEVLRDRAIRIARFAAGDMPAQAQKILAFLGTVERATLEEIAGGTAIIVDSVRSNLSLLQKAGKVLIVTKVQKGRVRQALYKKV